MRELKAQLVVCIIQDILLGFTQLNFDLLYKLDCVCAQHNYDFSFVLLHFFPSVFYIFFSSCFEDRRDVLKKKQFAITLIQSKTPKVHKEAENSQIKFSLALKLLQLLNFVSVF